MSFLVRPRGKGYSLRMLTPAVLVGTLNPWSGKPFGKEIKLGLNTRRHAEAIRIRDCRIGQIRQLEAEALAAKGKPSIGSIIDLTPANAAAWREMRAVAKDGESLDALDHVLTEELDRAERSGHGQAARAFGEMVFRGAMPLDEALERYLDERRPGNEFGFDELKIKTQLDVRSSMNHLTKFLNRENATLRDVTPDLVFKFRTEYLPLIAKVSPKTVAKHTTLMRGMWTWAIEERRLLRGKNGAGIVNPWIVETRGLPKSKSARASDDDGRHKFEANDVAKLLKPFPRWGDRRGDLLRLALATGCRADEIGSMRIIQIRGDGSAFDVREGKTANARRHVPLVGPAQELMRLRLQVAESLQKQVPNEERRLFPEWPIAPKVQKTDAISKWFTRHRRATLGEETDGRLVLHSFRHTWRTMARWAGVPEDRINELGGWKQDKNTSWSYDHGLHESLLREAQEQVWERLQTEGYLERF